MQDLGVQCLPPSTRLPSAYHAHTITITASQWRKLRGGRAMGLPPACSAVTPGDAPHQPAWSPRLGEDLSLLCLCPHLHCRKHDSPALSSLPKSKMGKTVGSGASPAWHLSHDLIWKGEVKAVPTSRHHSKWDSNSSQLVVLAMTGSTAFWS